MRASGYALASPDATSEAEHAERAAMGRRVGKEAVPPAERPGLVPLAAAGLSAGLTPQEPTGGQPGSATHGLHCYWCGKVATEGQPVWSYRSRIVAHPSCHADAMGEPAVGADERGPT